MVNDATIRLITEFEGFVPNWYPDPAHGWKVATCCYGHTDAAGAPFYEDTKAKKFTKAEGMEILRRDLGQYENAVNRAVKVPLNPNQYGALVSFTYNLGAANLEKSTLVKKLNAGDYAGAALEFKKWNKAGGKVFPGLTRRREAERQLFVAPAAATYTPKPPPYAPIPIEDEDPITTNAPTRNIMPWVIAAVAFVAIAFYVLTQVRF